MAQAAWNLEVDEQPSEVLEQVPLDRAWQKRGQICLTNSCIVS